MGQVIVVFPHSGIQRALADRHRRWLSRGQVQFRSAAVEPLDEVLAALRVPRLCGGRAALRLLGHSGQETDGWIAAAEPVSFEPRLRDIMAQRIPPGELEQEDFAALIKSAQDELADGKKLQFDCIDGFGYLLSTEPMPTATVSATTLHGFGPDAYLPSGEAGRRFHRLHSELQMLFHDHPVNQQRSERGLPGINGLWLWGGGRLADACQQELPVLFGTEPIFAGYWRRFGGVCKSWHDDIAECVRAAHGSAVFTVPESPDSSYDQAALGILDQLIGLLKSRRMTTLTIVFNNEARTRIRWADRVKFWRRQPEWFPEGNPHA